jgi:hypothetical protein
MVSKKRPTKSTENSPDVGRTTKADLQITAHQDGFLIKGDISLSHAGLKDFATWDEPLGAWIITKRRAYEYDHHYGLRLFSK